MLVPTVAESQISYIQAIYLGYTVVTSMTFWEATILEAGMLMLHCQMIFKTFGILLNSAATIWITGQMPKTLLLIKIKKDWTIAVKL